VHTAVDDPLVGRLLEGRYLIQAPLARGGMSTVYTATDQRLDRLVAVKVMSAALTSDPTFTDRFIREARAAARMTHVNAVAVYDQGDEAGAHGRIVFLVMELITGRTLRELLRERGRLTPAEALSIIEPVLAALAAAHRGGLIHRDIKPENILISDEGVVKVADFGLARAIETDGNSTSTGIMMGTVAYCSPEQISRGRTDARSDVYAAGIVLYELLTGTPPYVGETAVNVAFQHVHNRVPAPSERVRGIDPRLDELVLRATDSDPAGRPIDAGAFLAEMNDVRTDLDLPSVVIAGLSTVSKPRPRGAQNVAGTQADDHPTGQLPRGGIRMAMHNTLAVNSRDRNEDYFDDSPPPPVVIPPPKPRKQRTARYRRRRRTLIAIIALIVIGGSVGYASWWYASGRFSHVPALTGQSPAAATVALKKAGFQVSGNPQTQFSDTIAKNLVISTQPSAGARVTRNHKVSLVVSKGKELVAIPTVAVGSTTDEARALLGGVPIEVNAVTTSQPSDTVAAGKVLGTNPAGGTSVARGAAVALIVSSGPPILSVPDETAKTQTAATTDLKTAGFAVTVTTDYSPVIKAGLVISQTPGPGSSLAKFQTVTIDVSKGPAPVVVPNVIGQQISVAKTTLQGIGLTVKVDSVPFASLNNVVTMDPGPGATVPFGSQVTLYIN
jgi:serine/threonine protein kinase